MSQHYKVPVILHSDSASEDPDQWLQGLVEVNEVNFQVLVGF